MNESPLFTSSLHLLSPYPSPTRLSTSSPASHPLHLPIPPSSSRHLPCLSTHINLHVASPLPHHISSTRLSRSSSRHLHCPSTPLYLYVAYLPSLSTSRHLRLSRSSSRHLPCPYTSLYLHVSPSPHLVTSPAHLHLFFSTSPLLSLSTSRHLPCPSSHLYLHSPLLSLSTSRHLSSPDRSGVSSMRIKIDGTWQKDEHRIDPMRLDSAGRDKRCSYLILTDGKWHPGYNCVVYPGYECVLSRVLDLLFRR